MKWIWKPSTHLKINQLALQKMSKKFQKFINIYQHLFQLGVIAPDKIFADTSNHYYNITPNSNGYHSGTVVKKIEKEIMLIYQMMNNYDTVIHHPRCADYLKSIMDTPLKAVIFELGVISHYVADLHQPFHTDGKYHFPYEEVPHKIFEADVRKNFALLSISLSKRRYRIKNITQFFYNQIDKIHPFYDKLVDNYFLNPQKVKPDRFTKSISITEFCIGIAADNVANVWFLFEDKVNNYKSQIQYLLLHQKINSHLSPENKYSLKVYPSGTVSIRKN